MPINCRWSRFLPLAVLLAVPLTACVADATGGPGDPIGPSEPPTDAPTDVRMLTGITMLSATRAELTFSGVADLQGDWRADSVSFNETNSGSGWGCGSWRTSDTVAADGLKPGTTYTAYVVYQNHQHSSPLVFTTPALGDDATPPSVHGLEASDQLLGPGVGSLGVYANDETGIDRVEFFANGVAIGAAVVTCVHEAYAPYGGEAGYRLVALPPELHGTIAVEAIAYDVNGNATHSTATITRP